MFVVYSYDVNLFCFVSSMPKPIMYTTNPMDSKLICPIRTPRCIAEDLSLSSVNLILACQVSLSQGCYSLKLKETFDIHHNWKDSIYLDCKTTKWILQKGGEKIVTSSVSLLDSVKLNDDSSCGDQ